MEKVKLKQNHSWILLWVTFSYFVLSWVHTISMSNQNTSVLKKDDKGKNIQVVVRCRPFNAMERKSNSHCVVECESSRKEVGVRTGGMTDKAGRKTYTFDMVFGPSGKQIDVYRSVVCPILDEVIMGYNCTIFAYGQTGTGKTFTMEGERSPNEEYTWEEDPLAGIIPRTLHQIFEKLTESNTEFSVKVSLLEIYNEELFDLLSPSPDVGERLQIFDDPRNKRGVIIRGLEEVTVHNKDEVYQILERGAARRTTASTLMNAYSSRSHSVFSVTIHMKEMTIDGEELVKIGKLNLVDLAGSENIGRSGAVDKRAREAGNINQSLLTLGRVITALVERTPHVPYRESKLTRILQDSLGGRTKTSIIATISPASINLEETLSTLEYAHRAKNIMNKPEVNQKLTKRALIKEYTEEIERLKRDLSAAREKNGVYLSSENYEVMQGKLVSQEDQISELTEKISALEEELKMITDLFTDSKKEAEQYALDLQNKEQELADTQQNLNKAKQKLAEEEFVVSALEDAEKNLYNTASKLLSTVEVSTKDIFGLHAKLDRKRNVDQHNAVVQETFAERMSRVFEVLQESVDEQSMKYQGMLELYTTSIGDLLNANSEILTSTIATIFQSFSSIKEVVSCGISENINEILHQESLSLETKQNLQKKMEEHKYGMERVVHSTLLPGVASLMKLNDSLVLTFQNCNALADQIKCLRMDMSTFFMEHFDNLSKIKEDISVTLSALQRDCESLQEEINRSNAEHTESLSQMNSFLQGQMNLHCLKAQEHFDNMLTRSEAVKITVGALHNSIQMQSTKAMEDVTSHKEKFTTSADNVAVDILKVGDEGLRIVEKCTESCGNLCSAIKTAGQETEQFYASTTADIVSFADQQVSFLTCKKSKLRKLQQNIEKSCDSSVDKTTEKVKMHQNTEQCALNVLVDQIKDDQDMFAAFQLELNEHLEKGQENISCFLKEELKKDTSTGTTPQRRDYKYPWKLVRSVPRDLLLDQFRKQQQEVYNEFQNAAVTLPESTDQDFVEEQSVVSCNTDSTSSERSRSDDSVVCQENGGVPFFQHKKITKKEKENRQNSALQEKIKLAEESAGQVTPRSKLPLRIQN